MKERKNMKRESLEAVHTNYLLENKGNSSIFSSVLRNEKNNKMSANVCLTQVGREIGITLVALVVTIVVLLILSGITINLVFSDNGVISKAQQAAEKTKKAQIIDVVQLDILSAQMEGNITKTKLVEILGRYGTVKYVNNDSDYDISGLEVEGVSEVIPIAEIYDSALNDGSWKGDKTVSNSTINKVLSTTSNTALTDSNGNKIVLPAGFKIVSDSSTTYTNSESPLVDDGIVVEDSDKNQFVWIPANGSTVTYAKHVYASPSAADTSGSTADTGNGGWKTYYYRSYSSVWSDSGAQNASDVTLKGGFYIGRYEAGLPIAKNSGDTYTTESDKNVDTMVPVSKKGAAAWNFISQENALKVSAKMYENNAYVTSQLIDGIAWDTTTQWLQDSGINVTDSTSWGNYSNASFSFDGLYATHSHDGTNWTYASQYSSGSHTKASGERTEIATGIVERNKAKNIYDFAGNMWEWTTETGTYSEKKRATLRGGSIYFTGSYNPASGRNGDIAVSERRVNFGFRVVLYVQ